MIETLPDIRKTAQPRKKPLGAKVREACDLMVWGNEHGEVLEHMEAARAVGMTPRGMRKALERPDVRAHLLEQRQALRAALSAKTLSRLAELRDQNDNRNAAVAAARALEQLGDDAQPGSLSHRAAGLTIIIGGPAPSVPADTHTIEITPTDPQSIAHPPAPALPIFRGPA